MDGNDKLHPAARKYWQGVEDLRNDPEIAALRDLEFGPAPTQGDGSDVERRDFLKLVGTTFAAASITSGCARRPVEKVIPYVNKPEEITPGAPAYYATTCAGCQVSCGLLVKARDGRPVKIEGNPDHPFSAGGVCARGQASVIDLYDGDRLRHPQVAGAKSDWAKLDAAVATSLAGYKTDGKKLAIVSPTMTGAATKAAIDGFLKAFPGSRHVTLDGQVGQTIAAAHGQTHGLTRVPFYDFSRADTIVSFGADFLGGWIAPVWSSRQYITGRKLTEKRKTLSFHVQVESQLSLAGSSCDERLPVLPSEQRGLVLALAASIAKATGFSGAVPAGKTKYDKQVAAWSKRLLGSKGKSLVVSDSSDSAVQAAVNLINQQLGNYGKTLDVDRGAMGYGDGAAATQLLADLNSGAVDGIVVWGVNPAYASSDAKKWAAGIKKAKASIAMCDRVDETAALCKIHAAKSHYLESWGDAETTFGLSSLQQPLVRPLHDTRDPIASLLAWSGNKTGTLKFIQGTWKTAVMPFADKAPKLFTSFWDKALHDGFVRTVKTAQPGGPAAAPTPAAPPVPAAAADKAAAAAPAAAAPAAAADPAAAIPAPGVVPAPAVPAAAADTAPPAA
ncbi:MAG: TAT-variant-translocated molybdopterin oxidoreductase, partial [Myxococcales bacterium]|nr:TAT-variant-translocated molybdopterin oxidoreductase [Myxococcales bacterium]